MSEEFDLSSHLFHPFNDTFECVGRGEIQEFIKRLKKESKIAYPCNGITFEQFIDKLAGEDLI